jgi:hypothetical protein
VEKLQKKVGSLQLQNAKYRSCEVVAGDGVAQPGATQAEVASLAEQVERMGSAMLTKADLSKATQDICVEVAERQKSESAHHNAEIMAIFQQEHAALADRIDTVFGAVSDLSTSAPRLMGRQGPEEEGMETATDVLKFTPGNLRLKFMSAEELAQKKMQAAHGVLQLSAAVEAKQDFSDTHWAFANWKEHVLDSVMKDKKMFARKGRLVVPEKILKVYINCYRYRADVSLAGLKALASRWDDHCDLLAVANADARPGIWQNPKAITSTDEGYVVRNCVDTFEEAVATPHRAVVKGTVDVKGVMKTILKANALQQDKHRRRSSHAHPRMVQQERQSSPAPSSQSDGDGEAEDPVDSTGGESDDSVIQPGGVKGFFAFGADS